MAPMDIKKKEKVWTIAKSESIAAHGTLVRMLRVVHKMGENDTKGGNLRVEHREREKGNDCKW